MHERVGLAVQAPVETIGPPHGDASVYQGEVSPAAARRLALSSGVTRTVRGG